MLEKLKAMFGKLFFMEISPIIKTGRQRTLHESDFIALPDWLDPKYVAAGFKVLDTSSVRGFLVGVLLSNKPRMLLVGVILIGLIAANLMYPEIMHQLINQMKDLVEHRGTISSLDKSMNTTDK